MTSTQPTYTAVAPLPVYQQRPSERTTLLMHEAKQTYLFDASVCGGFETDEVSFHDDAVFVSRRFDCCCNSSVNNSVVKSREILSADISTMSSFRSIFLAWILFGCLGQHRFCAGSRTTGIIMFVCTVAGIVLTTIGFSMSMHAECGEQETCNIQDGFLYIGIVASFVLGLTVVWWFYDLFLIRHWAYTQVNLKTSRGDSTRFRISPHQTESFRADLEAQYRVH